MILTILSIDLIDQLAFCGNTSFRAHLLVLRQRCLFFLQLSLLEHLLLDQLIVTSIGLSASISRFNLRFLFLLSFRIFLILVLLDVRRGSFKG